MFCASNSTIGIPFHTIVNDATIMFAVAASRSVDNHRLDFLSHFALSGKKDIVLGKKERKSFHANVVYIFPVTAWVAHFLRDCDSIEQTRGHWQ